MKQHFEEVETVLKEFKTHRLNGLENSEVDSQREAHGKNLLPKLKNKPLLYLILEQFEDRLVLILLASAAISLFLGILEDSSNIITALIEPGVILLILIANAAVGVWQETNADAAIESLRDFESKKSAVIRNGQLLIINSEDLVPGDLVKLKVGERVPADCRLVNITSAGCFYCDESMLTGETAGKSKSEKAIPKTDHVVIQDMKNTLFFGSLVTKGTAFAVVVAIGSKTELGKIQTNLEELDKEKTRTPLQERLDKFAEQLSNIILWVCVLVWVVNIKHFTDPVHGGFVKGAIYYFKIAITLAVAAIPEGLPAVVTTCLALGTTRMAKKNAIVRTLSSVETLGCTTVICSDKTGTLTTNKMNVRTIILPTLTGTRELKVSGLDYSPSGKITCAETGEELKTPNKDCALNAVARIGSCCNESNLILPETAGKPAESFGMPIEVALRVMASKAGYAAGGSKRLFFFDFDRKRKVMSTVDEVAKGTGKQAVCHLKGAPEHVLSLCEKILTKNGETVPMTNSLRNRIEGKISQNASSGLRMLALAYKVLSPKELENLKNGAENNNFRKEGEFYELEKGLVFAGAVGMLDPPRKEVAAAVSECRRSGIAVKVITGDHQGTAESVCRLIGVLGENGNVKLESMTGKEFAALSPLQQSKAVDHVVLFSRVEPSHKLQLVRLLKEKHHVVAMTGDGVNDASALRSADIGIAMGSGTQVAQQAADMVLLDDNFATIVSAITEGRGIYTNTKQFIRYLISSNIGEVVCVFLIALLGLPECLIPVQLLWVNLVTDGLPATALSFNAPDPGSMRRKPRLRGEPIADRGLLLRYTVVGLYIGFATVFGFAWWFLFSSSGPRISFAQLRSFHLCGTAEGSALFPAEMDCAVFGDAAPSTIALSVLVVVEMCNAFNALSEDASLLTVSPGSNFFVVAAVALSLALHAAILYVPVLRGVFSTAPLGIGEWLCVAALSLPVFAIDEGLKFLSRNKLLYFKPKTVKPMLKTRSAKRIE